MQGKPESKLTYGDARRRASEPHTCNDFWLALHGVSQAWKEIVEERSQRGLLLGVSEEVKGFWVYLTDEKKVVTTQHVKYIQTLSRAQNLTLLTSFSGSSNSGNDGFIDVEGDTGLVLPIAAR
jgi:hypothetical protein